MMIMVDFSARRKEVICSPASIVPHFPSISSSPGQRLLMRRKDEPVLRWLRIFMVEKKGRGGGCCQLCQLSAIPNNCVVD